VAPVRLAELRGVRRRYEAADGGFTLHIAALAIETGERVVVLGPSGSGKSTLLDLLALLAAPERAESFVFSPDGVDHDIAERWTQGRAASLSMLRARHIGYVLQTGGLLPYLTVRENILLSRRLLGLAVPGPMPELAKALEIGDLLARKPAELSVGQRQRVAIARAIAHRPALLLADEPTAAVDSSMALRVVDALASACDAMGSALVLVTHDRAIASRVGGRAVECRPTRFDGAAGSVIEG
jgi:putative ABC transport system ATP-binding protein